MRTVASKPFRTSATRRRVGLYACSWAQSSSRTVSKVNSLNPGPGLTVSTLLSRGNTAKIDVCMAAPFCMPGLVGLALLAGSATPNFSATLLSAAATSEGAAGSASASAPAATVSAAAACSSSSSGNHSSPTKSPFSVPVPFPKPSTMYRLPPR